jgi:hypothetical protein
MISEQITTDVLNKEQEQYEIFPPIFHQEKLAILLPTGIERKNQT